MVLELSEWFPWCCGLSLCLCSGETVEKNWNIIVPGYGDDPRPLKKPVPSAAHVSRLAAIGKAQVQGPSKTSETKKT